MPKCAACERAIFCLATPLKQPYWRVVLDRCGPSGTAATADGQENIVVTAGDVGKVFATDSALSVRFRCHMRDQPPAETAPLILIADDNVDTREMYGQYLNVVGYRVETAKDGNEAIIKARAPE